MFCHFYCMVFQHQEVCFLQISRRRALGLVGLHVHHPTQKFSWMMVFSHEFVWLLNHFGQVVLRTPSGNEVYGKKYLFLKNILLPSFLFFWTILVMSGSFCSMSITMILEIHNKNGGLTSRKKSKVIRTLWRQIYEVNVHAKLASWQTAEKHNRSYQKYRS